MNETLFEILIYLLNHFLQKQKLPPAAHLTAQWEYMNANVIDLVELPPVANTFALNFSSIRLFSDKECEKIQCNGRGFILLTEQLGILTAFDRETLIQRLMASHSALISMDELKWTLLETLSLRMSAYQLFFINDILYPSLYAKRLH